MTSDLESKIFWENAKFLGVEVLALHDEFAIRTTEYFIKNYKLKTASIVCGLGGNGADGLAIAYHLASKGVIVNLYLIGRANLISYPAGKKIWEEIKILEKENKNLKILQDCYAKDVIQSDINLECLTGTGLERTRLNKRFKDVVQRISHFTSPVIAIDKPTLHYTPTQTISIDYPKAENAEVVQIDYPNDLKLFCGPGEKEYLWKPNKASHKNKNGNLLYVTSRNKNYDELKKASKEYEVNLSIFNFNNKTDQKQVNQNLDASEFREFVSKADSIIFDNLDENIVTYATLNQIVKEFNKKNFILTSSAINLLEIDKLKLANNIALLFNKSESSKLKIEDLDIDEGKLRRFASETKSKLIIFGLKNLLINNDLQFRSVKNNFASSESKLKFTKYLIAAYSTKNDLWLSMRAGMS